MTIKLLFAGDRDLRDALAEQFAREPEFNLSEAEAASEIKLRPGADAPDALLVADDVPGGEPAQLLRAARAEGFAGAAILLARSENAAAEDFCARARRPFRFSALCALIRSVVAGRAAEVTLGDQLFCAATQTLMDPGGARRPLTEKEAAILARLARAKGGVVTREVLLREIWGYKPAVATHTLETHIHRLRRKIERAPGGPRLLLTAQGGYRLTAAAGAGFEKIEGLCRSQAAPRR